MRSTTSTQFNLTVLNLGQHIVALEGTEASYCTASGMSAITAVLLQLVGQEAMSWPLSAYMVGPIPYCQGFIYNFA
jgi:cystathionine beta-lyase/cystathionine gamma-synthase